MEGIITALGKNIKVEIRNPEEHQQKYWARGNFYETQRNGLLNHIGTHEPKGGKYIDIGASIGNHSLFFMHVMNAGVLIAIEPDEDSYNHLMSNLILNGIEDHWHTYQIALGAEEGKCGMEWVSEKNIGMKQVREGEGEIPIKRIDDLDFFQGYDVIKIDVEHYNEELLIGAERTFTEGIGNIYIEAESEAERHRTDIRMRLYGYDRVQGLVFNHTPTYKYIKIRKP